MDRHLTIRVPRRLLKALLLVSLVAVVAAPIAVSASHVFDDVPDENVFHEDIAWLADAGVTLGCNPPANTNYCPEDNVTRGQMSAFMRRFAQYIDAEDGTPALADDADTLDGHDAGAFAMGDPSEADPLTFDESAILIDTATDTTVLTTVVTLADECGDGTTQHQLLALGGGSVEWVAGTGDGRIGITVDSTSLSFNGSTRIFALDDGTDNIGYHAVQSHYVATGLAPGDHTVRLMADGFNGNMDYEVEVANLAVVPMGWSCGS